MSKCIKCGEPTYGDNFICDGCREVDEFDDDREFIPCSECDGHPACEDFGCAYELGLGRLVKKNND